MNTKVWKVLKILLIVAVIVGAGFGIYRLGYAQGVVSNFSVEDMATLQEGFMNYGPRSGLTPHGFATPRVGYGFNGGFVFARLIGGLIFLFILGGIFRGFRRRRMMQHAFMMKHMGKDFEGYEAWDYGYFGGPCWGGKNKKKETTDEAESTEETSAE